MRAALAVLALAAVPVAAQDAGDGSSDLGLPKAITILGKSDPSVRKATAIVNNTIITETDIDQRLALVLAANNQQIPDEEKERLRVQVLSNLVDEVLEIQEAAANKITVSKAEIDQTYNRVAGNFKRSPKEFAEYLRSKGSSEASIRKQIEGETAWRRVLGRQIEPFINVGDDEVNQVMARLKAAKGAQEYRIGEIYLSANPANQAEVRANADRIVEQVRKGASFVAYARQYSEASTAAVGGDLGWVRAEQLPDQLAAVAQQLGTGQISDPIALPGGFSIIALVDKRQILMADPRDALLALKQISITFPAGSTREKAEPRVREFGELLKTIDGCGKAGDVATKFGAEVVDNDRVKLRDLPPALQTILEKLNIGQVTPPFGSVEEGVRALVLCGRDTPQAAEGPSFDEIQQQMQDERVNRRARRYLRDLRRDAVIEYR